MIVNAITVLKYINKNTKRIDVHTPKYPHAAPLISVGAEYEGKAIKFITGWADIPVSTPITINGSIIKDELVGKITLTRGMCVGCFGDSSLYIYMPEVLIK
jgi:hypothetical protein